MNETGKMPKPIAAKALAVAVPQNAVPPRDRRIDFLLGVVTITALHVPVFFLNFFFFSGEMDYLVVPIRLAALFIVFFAILSTKARYALMKLLLAAPLSYFVWLFFLKNDFMVRGVNYWYPYYGRLVAGSYFVANMMLLRMIASSFLTALIAIGFSYSDWEASARSEWVWRIKKTACPIACALVLSLALTLNAVFPSMVEVNMAYW